MVGSIGSSNAGAALSPLLARAGVVVDPVNATNAPQKAVRDPNARSSQQIAGEAKLSDIHITNQINQAVAQVGADSSVNVQYRYGIAPNGQLYIASANIATTQRVDISDTDVPLSQARGGVVNTPDIQGGGSENGLSAEEREVVRQLQVADTGVRTHEAQHLRAAGGLATGTPDFVFQQGPDGKYYAVAGAVGIQTTATTDPEKAARQSQALALAASAPSDASAQDNAVAGKALAQAGGGVDTNAFLQATQRYQNTANATNAILFPQTAGKPTVNIAA